MDISDEDTVWKRDAQNNRLFRTTTTTTTTMQQQQQQEHPEEEDESDVCGLIVDFVMLCLFVLIAMGLAHHYSSVTTVMGIGR